MFVQIEIYTHLHTIYHHFHENNKVSVTKKSKKKKKIQIYISRIGQKLEVQSRHSMLVVIFEHVQTFTEEEKVTRITSEHLQSHYILTDSANSAVTKIHWMHSGPCYVHLLFFHHHHHHYYYFQFFQYFTLSFRFTHSLVSNFTPVETAREFKRKERIQDAWIYSDNSKLSFKYVTLISLHLSSCYIIHLAIKQIHRQMQSVNFQNQTWGRVILKRS